MSEKTKELKTCPFCGSKKLETIGVDDQMTGSIHYVVACYGCFSQGGYGVTETQAKIFWNVRNMNG